MKVGVLKTNDISVSGATKTIVIGSHGAGKTSQALNYQKRYGKGLILSGESGLGSVASEAIDYIPFTSFSSTNSKGASFQEIAAWINNSDEFLKANYQWIAIDSVTELSQQCFKDIDDEHTQSGSTNNFEKWATYERKFVASLKWLRDMPIHVLITCLQKEENNDNGGIDYYPMVIQSKVAKLLPALYDHVFCLVRKTVTQGENVRVKRFIVTDNVNGHQGKTRDPFRRLRPVEDQDDVTALLNIIQMSKADYETFKKKGPTK
jgi:hypothetical protein